MKERDGVVVRAAECEEDLHAFFELHLKLRKYKYRMLAQPYHALLPPLAHQRQIAAD